MSKHIYVVTHQLAKDIKDTRS